MENRNRSASKTKSLGQTLMRWVIALVALFLCFQLFMTSARSGLSRFMSLIAIVQLNLDPANKAVTLAPGDPEAHYTRALTLGNLQRLEESVLELRIATRTRPHHYYEWLDLGVTLDRLGDRDGAYSALRESIRLAPAFAQPHWQLGNLLYRDGRYDEAFAELRYGAKSNPNLTPGMLDLAWVAASGDVARFLALVQPDNAGSHFEIARFLAKQGQGADSVRQTREAGPYQTDRQRNVRWETIQELLNAGDFTNAFEVWAFNRPNAGNAKEQVSNGDFLEPILQDEPGFGWQLPKIPNVRGLIDPEGPAPGTRSLRMEFSGDSLPAVEVARQLVLVGANSRYSLSFFAKTDQLVTGGPPVLVVTETGANARIVGQSNTIPPGTAGWTPYKVEISTGEKTSAVLIKLQRLQCSQNPCPVFGRLWMGGFKLNRI